MSRKVFFSALALGVLSVGTARAQSFPGADRYSPLPCGNGVMSDGYRDQANASRERDIVGDPLGPAGYRAADASFVYFRLRLDDNPAPGGTPRPLAWGFELDTDGDRSSYEWLILVDGGPKTVSVYRNSAMTVPNDPSDPPDTPAVASFPFATHAHVSVAPSSRYGGDDDWFLDVAVPWSTLEPLGITRTTPLVVWAATSSTTGRLDADWACHDGASGAPKLSTIAPPKTTLDPALDTDGDGWSNAIEVANGTNPNDPTSKPSGTPPPLGGAEDPVLAGAGGCTFVAGPARSTTLLFALCALAVGMVRRRGRRAR